MTDGIFDESVAPFYDASSAERFRPEVLDPEVDFLAELAGDGPALEFAIGTGRVAIPLARCGIDVDGIELSRPMVDRLRAKPGGERIDVVIGDMATTRIDRRYGLVYLVYNTITNLLTQAAQVDCFANAAAHLRPGGVFVVEVFVPELQRLPKGEIHVPAHVADDHINIDRYDTVNQILESHHTWIQGNRATTFVTPHRYAWPAEYDLMARLAGLRLRERWADWNRSPFTAASTSHVSVWEQPGDRADGPEFRPR